MSTLALRTNSLEMQQDIKRCILKRLFFFILFMSIVVFLSTYVPSLDQATNTDAFFTIASMSALLSLLLLVLMFVIQNRTYKRLTQTIVALSVILLTVVGAKSVRHKSTVPIAFVVATILLAIGWKYGAAATDLRSLAGPLLAGLLILILASIIGRVWLKVHWISIVLTMISIFIFTLFIAYDVNTYSKHCTMSKPECCEDGAFSVFLNFSNLVSNVLTMDE